MATRRERVVLELEDLFTPDMIKAAAATELLKRQLNSLSGQAVQSSRATRDMDRDTKNLGNTAGGSTRQLDRYSGRLRIIAEVAAILGPSLVPIGAVGIPAVTGLASSLGFAAAGAATALVAFQGVGDALKALNKAHLEPTVANLEAADKALAQLGPEAAHFATYLSGLTGEWRKLRDAAAGGLFPGVEAAIDSLLTRAPQVQRILERIGESAGGMLAAGGASLASERWDEFFDFIETEAPSALSRMGQAVGSLTHAMAELWMAFDPLNTDFLSWVVRATAELDQWASSLAETEGFAEFVDYVRESGPVVADTLGSIAMALVHIVEASAPLGGPVLKALGAIADVAGTIAGSPMGPPIMAAVTALSLFNRGLAVTKAVGRQAWVENIRGAETFGAKVTAMRGPLGRAALAGTGLAIASSGMAEGLGLSNTASMALMGTLAGPWGAAVGAGVGLALDFAAANDDIASAVARADAASRGTDLSRLITEQQALIDQIDAWDRDRSNTTGPVDFISGAWSWLASNNEYDAARKQVKDMQAEIDKLRDDLKGPLVGPQGEGQMFRGLEDSATTARVALEGLSSRIASVQNLLDRSGSLISYEQAVDDLTAAIEKNGQAWDVGTAAGRENLTLRNNLVDKAIGRAQVLKAAGDELGAQRILHRAIQDLKDFAGENPKAQAAMQPLIEELKNLDGTKAKPEVDVQGVPEANAELATVKTSLDALHNKVIRVTIEQHENKLSNGGKTPTGGLPTHSRTVVTGRTTSSGGPVVTIGGGPKYGGFGGGGINAPWQQGGNLVREALRDFSPDLASGAQAVSAELRQLAQALRADHLWTEALAGQANKIRHLADRYDRLADAAEKSAEALEAVEAQSQAFAQAVSGSFNTDVMGGNLAQFASGLTGDISNIGAMEGLLAQLQRLGLDATGPLGGLYQALAQSGNLTLAQQLLASGAGGIDYYESLYAQRAQDQMQFGQEQARIAFGQAIADAADRAGRDAAAALAVGQQTEQAIQDLRKDLKGPTAHAIGREVYDGAYDALKGVSKDAGRRRALTG